MVFGTTFSSQNLISETNKGELILKIDEGFFKFIKDPSNYGEINSDGSQNIKIYPGLGITDICAIDLFIANRSSNMFSNNSHNCLQRDLSDIDFISYTCLSENTIYDISLDNSFVEITIEYKPNKFNKLNEIKTNDISVNRNGSKLKFFNSPKIFNNALKRDDYSKYLITPEQNDEYNIPSRDLSGRFNNLIYYKSNKYEGDISTSLYIDDTSAEILTPVQLLNYKLLEIQEEAIKTDPSKNVFFNTKNWGNYTHPLSGFHLGALAYNNLLYNDLSYHNNVFYNENSGNYFDEQTYRKLTIPYMANKYVKRINDISLISNGFYDNIDFPYTDTTNAGLFPDLSLIYNSEFNLKQKNKPVLYEDKKLLFNIDNVWQHICDICFTDISYSPTSAEGDNTADISYFYHEISKNFFNIFNEDKTSNQSSNFIKWGDGLDFSCIKTKLGLPDDSIGRDCEIKIEYFYQLYDTADTTNVMRNRQMNYFFKGYDLSSCFGFFNSEHNQNIFRNITISGNSYDMSYIFDIGGDILSEPGLMESTMSPPINIESPPSNLDYYDYYDYYDLCGGKIKYKKKYGYTLSNFNINKSKIHTLTAPNSNQTSVNFKKIKDDNFNNGLWSFYTNNVRYSDSNEDSKIYNSILKNKIINTYLSSDTSVCDLKIKDILHSSYNKYLKYMDKNFFSFNKWINLKKEFSTTESNSIFNNNSIFNDNDYFLKTKLDFSNISILTVDDLFEKKAFVNKAFYNGETTTASLITIRKDMYKTEPSKGFNINGSKSFSIHEPVQYHTIDDYINDISYSLSDNNKPLLSNSLITKYFSGGIYLIFRYIDFINQENNIMSKSKWVTSNDAYDYEIFPFISLGYNFNVRTEKYQLQVTSDNYGIESFNYGNNNFLIDNNEKFPELRVYARKARQDINTKKLLDIKEFNKIPLFLYKDPFVNNHHQFEITSETIPTIYPALTCDVSSISINLNNIIIEDRQLYNKKNLEEIYLTVDFTNSTNNLNNRFLSNFKTQLNKNNELLYFAQQNKNNPPIKFKIRNSNYDDFPYYFGTDNSYSIVNGQYSSIINDLISFNLPRFQYRPIYETINTNILSILNCNNNPDFSTNFGNKHFENLLTINNNKLPKLNEEKYTYKLIDYSDNTIYNLNKIYEYDIIDLSSYSYFADISLNDNIKKNVLEAFNDICTNYYDMSLINYMNNKNSRKIDNFPLYQNISIKIDINDYTNTINDASNYKLDLQLWDVLNMFNDLSNKYQIDFSNINCKGSNIFSLTQDISINNDWNYIYNEKLLRSRDFSFTTSDSIDLSFSINITDLSNSKLSMTINNFLDFSYNLYDSTTNSTISNESISNLFVLNFNYLTSRDNSENFNYYLNNVKNLNIIDNPDRNLLENYNNDNLNNFNMKMFDFETLHPKIHSNIINDNIKIDICPEAFLNCDLFFENNFNLYDKSYDYYKINNTKDPNYLDMSNSKLNISELFEYKIFSSSNLIQDISKSIETFNFTPFTKKLINDISFYFSDNINYIYSNKYSPLNINVINDLIPNVNLIDNNKVVYKNTILLPKNASNLFADLNFDKINCLMNFTKTENCDKMFKNTLSLYDNKLLKFSAFNNFNNNISLNEMFMNSSINYFPYLLINSLKNIPNTSKIKAKDIITNCDNMYLNEYFLAIRSFSEVLDFDNNLKYINTELSNVEISWNLTNNKYFGGAYPLNYYFGPEKNPSKFKDYTINKTPHLLTICDSEKGIYWDYYIDTDNSLNCINKLNKDVLLPNTNNSSVSRLLSGFGSRGFELMTNEVWQYQDFSLNIYKKKEYGGFHLLGYNKNSSQYIGGDLYWSIGFLLKILGFTDLSNQTHYNKPISLNSKYEQRRKFLKEKMYKHNDSDQILDWYGVDDICCGQPLTNRDSYVISQKTKQRRIKNLDWNMPNIQHVIFMYENNTGAYKNNWRTNWFQDRLHWSNRSNWVSGDTYNENFLRVAGDGNVSFNNWFTKSGSYLIFQNTDWSKDDNAPRKTRFNYKRLNDLNITGLHFYSVYAVDPFEIIVNYRDGGKLVIDSLGDKDTPIQNANNHYYGAKLYQSDAEVPSYSFYFSHRGKSGNDDQTTFIDNDRWKDPSNIGQYLVFDFDYSANNTTYMKQYVTGINPLGHYRHSNGDYQPGNPDWMDISNDQNQNHWGRIVSELVTDNYNYSGLNETLSNLLSRQRRDGGASRLPNTIKGRTAEAKDQFGTDIEIGPFMSFVERAINMSEFGLTNGIIDEIEFIFFATGGVGQNEVPRDWRGKDNDSSPLHGEANLSKFFIAIEEEAEFDSAKITNDDYSLNQVNLFNLFPETSYCWLDLSVNLSYHDIYNENNYIDKVVKPNMNLNIMKNEPFYRTDTLYDFPNKIHYANEYLNLSWLERFAINQLNTGYNFNDSPVFRYIYVNSFSTPLLNDHTSNTLHYTHISDILINVKVNNDQSFVLIDNSICELFNLSYGNMYFDSKLWFNDGSGIYTSIGNGRGVFENLEWKSQYISDITNPNPNTIPHFGSGVKLSGNNKFMFTSYMYWGYPQDVGPENGPFIEVFKYDKTSNPPFSHHQSIDLSNLTSAPWTQSINCDKDATFLILSYGFSFRSDGGAEEYGFRIFYRDSDDHFVEVDNSPFNFYDSGLAANITYQPFQKNVVLSENGKYFILSSYQSNIVILYEVINTGKNINLNKLNEIRGFYGFGMTCCVSDNGYIIVGSFYSQVYNYGGVYEGQISVYKYDSDSNNIILLREFSAWEPNTDIGLGRAVSITSDGNYIAFVGVYNKGIEVWEKDSTDDTIWTQVGSRFAANTSSYSGIGWSHFYMRKIGSTLFVLGGNYQYSGYAYAGGRGWLFKYKIGEDSDWIFQHGIYGLERDYFMGHGMDINDNYIIASYPGNYNYTGSTHAMANFSGGIKIYELSLNVITSDNIKIPTDYQDNSKKFPFLHFKSGDDISKNVRLDRLQTIASGISQNPNFWLKIDLGFILNKLYPNDFPSQTIALDRINYIYFYEGLQESAQNNYDISSNNLTYILSNINYSSVYEEPEKNPYYSYYNNLLQPGFGYTHNNISNTNYINKSYNFLPPEAQINDITNYNTTSPNIPLAGWGGFHYAQQKSNINFDRIVLYNYKVFNCNELNLFTYTNGFDKKFNMDRVDVGNKYKNIIDFDYFKTKIAIDDFSNSMIPKNNKIGILIKGNSDISDNRIFTEISNNIGYLNSLKHQSRLVTREDISNNTIRFDYTPYQNRSDYETREIKNYFIENYYNLIQKSVDDENIPITPYQINGNNVTYYAPGDLQPPYFRDDIKEIPVFRYNI